MCVHVVYKLMRMMNARVNGYVYAHLFWQIMPYTISISKINSPKSPRPAPSQPGQCITASPAHKLALQPATWIPHDGHNCTSLSEALAIR